MNVVSEVTNERSIVGKLDQATIVSINGKIDAFDDGQLLPPGRKYTIIARNLCVSS